MNIQSFIKANSPAILTGFSVAGVIGTAVLASKAAVVARDYINAEEIAARTSTGDADYECNNRRKVELTWRFYIPAGLAGAATIATIVGAHRIGMRRQASLIGAYTLADSALREYKEQVLKVVSPQKAGQIEDEINKERLHRSSLGDSQVYITGLGEQLCMDSLSGRYFNSDVESIRRAANDVNQQVLRDMYASQNDFYEGLGLAGTTLGAEMGWNIDNLLDVHFSTLLAEDGRPCLVLGYVNLPKVGYDKI
jgi:Family of unknown function (DUF6353)